MKKDIGCLLFASILTLLVSCTHKSTDNELSTFKEHFHTDEFPLRGNYHWDFQLMGATQNSVHSIYADSIIYSMKGKVYSTDYTMQKLSFDKKENKWIGRDEDDIVYVLFFKDIRDSSMSIYKHKCKANGIQEALDFPIPYPNATEDHGWNTYTRDKADTEDILPVNGLFVSESNRLEVADSLIRLDDSAFLKLSYHDGERRWVGQNDSSYLQIFVEDYSDMKELSLSVKIYEDIEQAYQTKFKEISFENYTKQVE